jgi:hypothetical protein
VSCDIGQYVIVCDGYYMTAREEGWLRRRWAVFAVVEFLQWGAAETAREGEKPAPIIRKAEASAQLPGRAAR